MSDINIAVGELPELDWVKVEQIAVDHNYQREIKPNLVNKILTGFRWDYFGAVVLARQDGDRYHVTDGQHRVKAASLHPDIDKVPALIVAGTGLESEAANFLAINRDRQSVNAVDRYWAGVTAKDTICLHIAEVLAGADCDIVPAQGAKGPRLTHAVSAVQRAIKNHGDAAVTGALLTIRETWPSDDHALRGVLITTLARLIRNNENLDQDRLGEILKGQSFANLTAHAESFRKLSGGSAETALAKTISEIYNRGRSKNQIYFGVSK